MKARVFRLVAGSFLALVAASSPAASQQSSTDTLQISALVEMTGAIAYAGQAVLQGIQLGVDEANKSGRLGKYKLQLDIKDAASMPAATAAMTSQIAKSDSLVILGPALSNDALAAAPIAQREKIPLVTVQSNTEGLVETGEYVYRLTTPLYAINGLSVKYLQKTGARTLALAYVSDIASLSALGKTFVPKWTQDAGIKLVASEATPRATTDFSTTVAKLIAANPDAIGLLNLDTQLTALIAGLRRSGFKGPIFTHSISPTTVKAIGEPTDGLLQSLDYAPVMTNPSSVAFTKAFTAKFSEEPYNYHANGYDALMFVVAALEKVVKSGKTPDRTELLKAMGEVARAGFTGASGATQFDSKVHRDARVPGVLIKYKGGIAELLETGVANVDE